MQCCPWSFMDFERCQKSFPERLLSKQACYCPSNPSPYTPKPLLPVLYLGCSSCTLVTSPVPWLPVMCIAYQSLVTNNVPSLLVLYPVPWLPFIYPSCQSCILVASHIPWLPVLCLGHQSQILFATRKTCCPSWMPSLLSSAYLGHQ
jgi:hypothetical protein